MFLRAVRGNTIGSEMLRMDLTDMEQFEIRKKSFPRQVQIPYGRVQGDPMLIQIFGRGELYMASLSSPRNNSVMSPG